MADKTLEKLRSLLKTFDERFAKAQGAAKSTHDEGERRRRACGGRLQTVVRFLVMSPDFTIQK